MGKPFLEVSDKTGLIQIVAELYEFIEPRDRRVFIQESAGLGRFLPGLNLAGNPRTVAGDLIGRLERFGELPDRPAYHALGALLDAMLAIGDLPDDQKQLVANLIVRYSLVADEPYLEGLRQRYAIVTSAVRPPASTGGLNKGIGAEFATSPSFEPRLRDERALETIINSEDNFLDIYLLKGALYSAQAVGRVELPEGTARGTGFLIGPNLLLTNNHVLAKREYLEQAVVRFGYFNDASGVPQRGKVVKIETDFYFMSPADDLDYSLVRLQERPLQEVTVEGDLATRPILELAQLGKHRGYVVLAPGIPVEQARVNILQHPNGDPLKVVLTQNYVDACVGTRLRYVADTMEGSSGSPVFNQRWEVVALHHSGTPYPREGLGGVVKKAWKGRFRVNEGVLVRAILADFKSKELDQYLPRN